MGSLSIWHWLLFLTVALLVFGGSGKISSIMGDVAKGIKSFKKGMSEDEETVKKDEPPKVLEGAARQAGGAGGRGAQQGRLERQELSFATGWRLGLGAGLRAVIPRGKKRARERAIGLS